MKIIHTGDLHIGSAFVGLSQEKAILRRAELTDGFRRLCFYAKDNGVTAVLIAGDFFDSNAIAPHIKREVLSAMAQAKPVCFFYVSGHHDNAFDFEGAPDNFYTFGGMQAWKSYRLPENVIVTGADTKRFDEAFSALPAFDPNAFNLLLLHGDTNGEIPLGILKNRNIDYIALGHVHAPTMTAERLDGRCKHRYCGCFEGRGFDELGRRGCFLLRIERGKIYEEQFLSFATREMAQIRVDISRCREYFDVEGEVTEALRGVRKEDCVKIVLKGTHKAELRKDVSLLSQRLAPHYFRVEIVDESRAQVDLDTATLDRTERGEFIRECRKTEMDEAFRAEVMEVGLKALSGEDIDV